MTKVGVTVCVNARVSIFVRVLVRDFKSCDGKSLLSAVGTVEKRIRGSVFSNDVPMCSVNQLTDSSLTALDTVAVIGAVMSSVNSSVINWWSGKGEKERETEKERERDKDRESE